MRKRIITLFTLAIATFGLLGSTAASAGGIGTQAKDTNHAATHAVGTFELHGPAAASTGDVGTLASEEIDYAVVRSLSSYTKYCAYNDYGPLNVRGCVQPYGDIFWLKDLQTDSHHVTLVWVDMDGTRYGKCVDNKGKAAGWTACNKNLPEGHEIWWQVKWYEAGWHVGTVYSTYI